MERQGSPVLDPIRASALGSMVVTEHEVLLALRRSKLGKAPGRDGIPVDLYKKFKTQFVPILAAVFTAIGVLNNLPHGFLDGVITVLHKKGDRLDAGNYRPISLTNTDYRVLARVLAGRLGDVLPDLIDPAQTAFIKGRCIGDSAMLLQLVADLLKSEDRTAILAFCDFRKAYDTVDRHFLLAVAEKMGLGQGFVQWVRLLLQGTHSAALINGYLAEPKLLLAGVRQGCPLAPLLYLLIAHALLCWLKDQGIGITVAGCPLAGDQFADDLKAFLENNTQVVVGFKAAMATFGAASGQHLLPAKTQLLFIGKPLPHPLPTTIAGMPVVHKAKALGLWYEEFTGAVSVDWTEMLDKATQRLNKISRCKLSVFGRAFACNAYALSTFLYHAEFTGVDASFLANLTTRMAAVIDRSQPHRPAGPAGRKFTGVAAANLVGHPKNGGFGLMSVVEHVQARAAKWPLRLASASLDSTTPWIRVARALLRSSIAKLQVKYDERLLLLAPNIDTTTGILDSIPLVVRKLLTAMLALPPATVLDEADWQLGPWCHVMPLWGNPMLQYQGRGLEYSPYGDIFSNGPWQTFGDLLQARATIAAIQPDDWPSSGLALYGDFFFILGETHSQALAKFQSFYSFMLLEHPGWFSAARAAEAARRAGHPLPVQAEVVEKLCKSVGWRMDNRSYSVDTLTVKVATALITQINPDWRLPQSAKLQAFVVETGLVLPEDVILKVLQRLWKLPVDNSHKEVVWRLAMDGLPTIQRLHRATQPCGCGGAVGAAAGRQHVYFECAAIKPILDSIVQQLQGDWALAPGVSLQRHHLWLAMRPTEALHQGVWDLVCISALKAMDSCRAGLFKRVFTGAQPGTALAASVGARACAQFWANLGSFCGHNLAPRAWRDQVSQTHPFITFDSDTATWNLNR